MLYEEGIVFLLSVSLHVCVYVCLSVRYHYIYSVPLHTEHKCIHIKQYK